MRPKAGAQASLTAPAHLSANVRAPPRGSPLSTHLVPQAQLPGRPHAPPAPALLTHPREPRSKPSRPEAWPRPSGCPNPRFSARYLAGLLLPSHSHQTLPKPATLPSPQSRSPTASTVCMRLRGPLALWFPLTPANPGSLPGGLCQLIVHCHQQEAGTGSWTSSPLQLPPAAVSTGRVPQGPIRGSGQASPHKPRAGRGGAPAALTPACGA